MACRTGLNGLRIVRWAPVNAAAAIPPLGEALAAHIEGYRNQKARAASIAAWALLYETLLSQNLPVEAVRFTPRGKPCFPACGVWFSLSHAGDLVAVSVADVPTGVDVERCERTVNRAVLERCLSSAESAHFDGDFVRLWCRKECIVKLTGEGLCGYPADVNAFDSRFTFREELLQTDSGSYRLTAAFQKNAASD